MVRGAAGRGPRFWNPDCTRSARESSHPDLGGAAPALMVRAAAARAAAPATNPAPRARARSECFDLRGRFEEAPRRGGRPRASVSQPGQHLRRKQREPSSPGASSPADSPVCSSACRATSTAPTAPRLRRCRRRPARSRFLILGGAAVAIYGRVYGLQSAASAARAAATLLCAPPSDSLLSSRRMPAVSPSAVASEPGSSKLQIRYGV